VGRIALAFLLGNCCVHLAPTLPKSAFALALLFALALACVARAKLIVAFLLGLGWAWGHAVSRLADDLPSTLEGADLVVTGYVASLPETSEEGDVRFELDVSDAEPGVPQRLRLSWYGAPSTPQPGETWQLLVRLKRRSGSANPGAFDYEGYLFRKGIGATGYVRADERNRRVAAAGWRYAILQARAWIAQRMQQARGPDAPMIGVLQGLAVGDTRRMTRHEWQVFAATGTTHLMAISGLHITMVAAMAAWLGGAIVRWPGAQARGWCALHGQAIAGVAAAVAYSLLAGFSVPTQRTTAMLCVYFAARCARRDLQVGHALALAAIVVLLIDPFAPLAVGAWLSFGAVALLVLTFSGRLQRMGPSRSFVYAQLAMTVGLFPLLLVAFGAVSLVSPFANAIAIPMFTFVVVPLALAGALLATVSPLLASLPLELATLALDLLWWVLERMAELPHALWYFPTPTWVSLGAAALGALVLVMPATWPIRLLGIALCGQVFFVPSDRLAPGEFVVTAVDVGQGQALVVRTQRHVLVYDTGPAFQSGQDAASYALLPYLRAKGVRRVDAVVVSHGDLDHLGGLATLLKGMRVEAVIVGPSVAPIPVGAQVCEGGQAWTWDAVRFEVLHPARGFVGKDNDRSCVLRISGSQGSALLTGDIEMSAEVALVAARVPRTDIVTVPHHGSRTSSSADFVAALAPKVALVSAGYRNRWGFPKADIVERWQASGARIYSTIDSGAIEARVHADGSVAVSEYRRTHRRYWLRTANE
jgi:competence protein ComEC